MFSRQCSIVYPISKLWKETPIDNNKSNVIYRTKEFEFRENIFKELACILLNRHNTVSSKNAEYILHENALFNDPLIQYFFIVEVGFRVKIQITFLKYDII